MNEVAGGTNGFIRNILPFLINKKVSIFGISLTDSKVWEKNKLNNTAEFISICKLKYCSIVPKRLICFYYYFKNRNKILKSGLDILYVILLNAVCHFFS